MELSDKAAAVQRMQDYIVAHVDEEIDIDELSMPLGTASTMRCGFSRSRPTERRLSIIAHCA